AAARCRRPRRWWRGASASRSCLQASRACCCSPGSRSSPSSSRPSTARSASSPGSRDGRSGRFRWKRMVSTCWRATTSSIPTSWCASAGPPDCHKSRWPFVLSMNVQQRESVMKARLDAYQVAPELLEAMRTLDRTVQENGALEHSLIELVKIRASQINGCAYCVHMHTADARAAGESEQRIYLLSAWRESSLYSAREKAALAWTEALTLLADT